MSLDYSMVLQLYEAEFSGNSYHQCLYFQWAQNSQMVCPCVSSAYIMEMLRHPNVQHILQDSAKVAI